MSRSSPFEKVSTNTGNLAQLTIILPFALQKVQSLLTCLLTAHPLTSYSLFKYFSHAFLCIRGIYPLFSSLSHTCCTYTPKYSRNILVKLPVSMKFLVFLLFIEYFYHVQLPQLQQFPLTVNSEIKFHCFLKSLW